MPGAHEATTFGTRRAGKERTPTATTTPGVCTPGEKLKAEIGKLKSGSEVGGQRTEDGGRAGGPGRKVLRPEVDAALDQIVNRRLGEAAQLIKQDFADWLDTHGAGGSGVRVEGHGGPRYAVRAGGAIWQIVYDWKAADWKPEKGLRYAAFLLKNPPREPIHGTKLAAMVFGYADIQELSLGADEAAGRAAIEAEARELASVLANDCSEFEKEEARARLEVLAALRKLTGQRPETNAEKMVRAVRKALHRLHGALAGEKGVDGKAHPVLVPFAEYLDKYLLRPSARCTGGRWTRRRAGLAGCFTYEPPDGVVWAD